MTDLQCIVRVTGDGTLAQNVTVLVEAYADPRHLRVITSAGRISIADLLDTTYYAVIVLTSVRHSIVQLSNLTSTRLTQLTGTGGMDIEYRLPDRMPGLRPSTAVICRSTDPVIMAGAWNAVTVGTEPDECESTEFSHPFAELNGMVALAGTPYGGWVVNVSANVNSNMESALGFSGDAVCLHQLDAQRNIMPPTADVSDRIRSAMSGYGWPIGLNCRVAYLPAHSFGIVTGGGDDWFDFFGMTAAQLSVVSNAGETMRLSATQTCAQFCQWAWMRMQWSFRRLSERHQCSLGQIGTLTPSLSTATASTPALISRG